MTYYAAIYARISSDKGQNMLSESEAEDTINQQIEIVKKYIIEAKQKGDHIEIFDIYKDIGKTGSNFSRKEFLRMMEDIRTQKVNCVIVKDLSRFGRDYIETGNYIEKIFPFLEVRFIAVSEQYDTNDLHKSNNKIAVDIKNLMNDIYVKEASHKAKIQLMQRRDRGDYVGGPAPYGYRLTKLENKQKLIVDPDAKEIVRFIYRTFLKEKSCTAVAKILSEKMIYTPLQYRKTNAIYSHKREVWNRGSVERILKNVTYLGILAQGKTSITGRDERRRIKKEEREWVVREECHEPIVDAKTFQKAQEIMQEICHKSSKHRRIESRTPLSESIFADLLCCGVCRKRMVRGNFICKNKSCNFQKPHEKKIHIDKEIFSRMLEYSLKTQFITKVKYPLLMNQESNRVDDRKLERLLMLEGEQYLSYCQGEIDKEQYADLLQKSRADEKQLRTKMKSTKDKLKSLEELKITADILNIFIEKICVFPNHQIHIYFTFR